jgi:hypothetical protein
MESSSVPSFVPELTFSSLGPFVPIPSETNLSSVPVYSGFKDTSGTLSGWSQSYNSFSTWSVEDSKPIEQTIFLDSFESPSPLKPTSMPSFSAKRPAIVNKYGVSHHTSMSSTSMINECPFKICPFIPLRQSFIYHRCCTQCPGHNIVMMERRQGLKIHHWVKPYDREGIPIRGHYRMNK